MIDKLKLTRDEQQELKLFFMIGKRQSPPPSFGTEERIIFVLAFELEEAFKKANIKNPEYTLGYNGQSMTVNELLSQLQIDSVVSPTTNKKEAQKVDPLPQEQISFNQFKTGLLFFLNEEKVKFKKVEDKEKLKEIVKTLNYETEKRN